MKKTNIAIVMVLLLGALIGIGVFASTGYAVKGNDELVVGAILPLSGDLAFLGEDIRRGMEIANDDLNLKIIYEDDEFSPITAVKAANKLINIDGINVGLTVVVEETKPIASIFENADVPLMTVWDSSEFIKDSEFLFSTGFSLELGGEKMAEYAYDDMELRRIAIVSHNDPASEVLSDSFREKFEELGGEIVLQRKHNLEDVDFRGTITKIKSLDVDGVYAPLIPPMIVDFLVQSKKLGFDKQLLSANGLLQNAIDAAEGAAEGVVFTNIYADNTEALRRKYVSKFGEEPIDITMVSFGFDGLNTIAKAFDNNAEDLRSGLIEEIGPMGTLDKEERIFRVVNGQQILVVN